MQRQSRVGPWIAVLLVLMLSTAVGFVAYRVGFGHGVAQGVAMNLAAAGPEAAKGAPNAIAPVAPYGPYPYGWHGHWGWGFFPFGFFGPLLFLMFWFFVVRMLLWGGPWRGGPWRRRGWYDDRRHL